MNNRGVLCHYWMELDVARGRMKRIEAIVLFTFGAAGRALELEVKRPRFVLLCSDAMDDQ